MTEQVLHNVPKLLTETDMTVTEIAVPVRFSGCIGVAPLVYRRDWT